MNTWKVKASECAHLIIKKEWHPAVLAYIESTLSSGKSLGIACSGGVDSLCLLLACYGHWEIYARQFIVLHFNHQLRGADADADATFVQNVSESLGLTYVLGYGSGKGQHEADFRKERHSFFKEILQKNILDGLLFGHHLDDAAETCLMRLSRGSGAEGLIAPRPLNLQGSFTYARPFLNMRRVFLEDTLKKIDVQSCMDHTNFKPQYERNAIRLSLLPVWKNLTTRCIASGIVRSQSLLAEDADALNEWVSKVWCQINSSLPFNIQQVNGLPRALVRRLFYRLWPLLLDKANCCDASYGLKEMIIEALIQQQSGRYALGKGWVIIHNGYLDYLPQHLLTQTWGPLPLLIGENCYLPDGSRLYLSVENVMNVDHFQTTLYLPDSFCQSPLRVRSWIPGDRYQPLGCIGTKKLKDQFIDYKIPYSKRRSLPIVCDDTNAVLWVPGIVPSEKVRLKNGQKCALRLTYEPKM